MTRRALRKIGAGLDLSRWLKTFDDLPRPWDGEALFDRDAPLEVELGSGKGLFLAAATTAQPDTNFLGLEVSYKYARHVAARLAQRDAANGCVVHGDGLRVFREFLPADAVSAIHVYFPDPWWKARHKKRRVINAAFLADVERTLVPGGTLHFWTDVQEYFETSLALVADQSRLVGPFDVPEPTPHHDLDYRTHFERRTRLNAEPVYRAEFRKPSES